MTSSVISVISKDQRISLQVIATDIDGTLTSQGVISAGVVNALSDLNQAGFRICLVTGRSSGWVQGLVSYLPVHAAIAENGGVLFLGAEAAPLVRDPRSDTYRLPAGNEQRTELRTMFEELRATRPFLQETEDNVYRLSDFTFQLNGLSQSDLGDLRTRVESSRLAFTWSTIHAHIMPRGQEKGAALGWLLAHWGITHDPAATTLTVGDSPNDATLFDEKRFPNSMGVANIEKYRDVMQHFPKAITSQREGEGFIEIARALLQDRRVRP